MSNKKNSKGRAKSAPRKPKQVVIGLNKHEEQAASERVTRVIQQMLKPPESIVAHIQRVGAPHWVSPFGIDAEGKPYHRPCLVVPYDDLISAELSALTAGGEMGEAYTPETQRQSMAAAKKVVQATGGGSAIPNSASSEVLDQLRQMNQVVAQMKQQQQASAPDIAEQYANLRPMARQNGKSSKNSDIIDDDDDWPLGEVKG